jgi:cobalt-zinc-cadmium efflux system membrane fusion protein
VSSPSIPKSRFVVLITLFLVLAAGYASRHLWWSRLSSGIEKIAGRSAAAINVHSDERHDDRAYGEASHEDHAGHAGNESLELSAQAMQNLGLTPEYLKPIRTGDYFKTISIPAMIVERPGRSVIQVSTPMTGVVVRVSAVLGSAVSPGAPLFQIRLTHEELVTSQTDFVRALGELDVENRELKRLQSGVDGGVIPPRSLLERQYAKEKLEALLGAQREALRLHGLSERQVAGIEKDRRLLSELNVITPSRQEPTSELRLSDTSHFQPVSIPAADTTPINATDAQQDEVSKAEDTPLIVESVDVSRGQSIEQGGRLCALADYSRLYIEGRAFEQDSAVISAAAARHWKVRALLSDGQSIDDLPIAFVASEIDEESRTLKLYVDLPNEILRDQKDSDGHRFVSWKYKPGQRLQLLIPVDQWTDQIIVPVDAVAQEAAEFFVFQQNGRHFDRIPVHVIYRDRIHAVIANDGTLFPGDIVALRNAHQMQMAVRNKAGGTVDPHAGHNH